MDQTDKIEKYIESLPPTRASIIRKLHNKIKSTLPELEIKLWGGKIWGGYEQNIIGYGEYNVVYSSGKKVNWFLIGLTNQKNYISLYINAVEGNEYIAEKYKETLGKVSVGKSCMRFKNLEDVNLASLMDLVKKATVSKIGGGRG